MNEEEVIKDLKRVNSLEQKIEILINHLEQYIQNRIEDKAQATQKVIEQNLVMIMQHLNNIKHHLKDKKTIKLVSEEVKILANIRATVQDLTHHPENIKKDNWKIHKLEEFLKVVEKKEKQVTK